MSETPAADPSCDAPDPRVAVAEQQLAVLDELVQIGMEMARVLRDRAVAAPQAGAPVAKTKDPMEVFARVSRAIRLTLALQSRTAADLHNLRAGLVIAREEQRQSVAKLARAAESQREDDRVERIRDLVLDAIDREAPDDKSWLALEECLEERLEEDEAYAPLPDRPAREIVERICADLRLTPDWSLWEGEGWKPKAPFTRPRSSWWREPRTEPFSPEWREAHNRRNQGPAAGFERSRSPDFSP